VTAPRAAALLAAIAVLGLIVAGGLRPHCETCVTRADPPAAPANRRELQRQQKGD
jgi:hypothetical protein